MATATDLRGRIDMGDQMKLFGSDSTSPESTGRRLLDARGNVMLRAGAGTGKTYNLTQKVLHLVTEQGMRLDEILVLTFTDYAAAEMRERIYEGLGKAIRQAQDPAMRDRLVQEKRKFPSNYISTFHSFCNRILQYYPDDVAGIEVSTLPDGLDNSAYGTSGRIRLESGFEILGSYEEILQKQEIRRDFYRLCKDCPALRSQLNNLRPADLEAFCDDLADLGEENLRRLVLLTPEQYIGLLQDLASRMQNEADALFGVIRERLNRHADDLKPEYVTAAMQGIEAYLGESNKPGDVPKKYIIKGADADAIKADLDPLNKRLKVYATDIAGIRETVANPDLSLELSEYRAKEGFDPEMELYWNIRELAEVSLRWTVWQRSRRMKMARLNFDDIIWLTGELLQGNPAVAADLRARFRYVLVDEFQDTDRRQWDIVKTISRIRTEPNVLVVGDVKQAIYGFRGGDVTVMDLAARDMDEKRTEHLSLDYSFRSAPAVTGFCNALFRHCFGRGHGAPFEAEAQDLLIPDNENARNRSEQGRVVIQDFDASVLDSVAMDASNSPTSPVTPLTAQNLSERVKNDRMWFEALRVARTLKRISLGEEPGFERITRLMQSGGKAVGILLKRRKYQYLYEMALKKAGLPFSVSSGRGFFNRQEVTDVANLLRFLLDAFDDLSMAGVLRSPWVGLSDNGLLAIRNAMNTDATRYPTFWAAVKDWRSWDGQAPGQTLIPPDRLCLDVIADVLETLRSRAKLVRVSDLIEEALVGTAFLAGWKNDRQVVQNIHKLLTVIRELEQEGEGSLFEIVTFLTLQAEEEVAEKDAGLPETGSIQIMTIHGSKGLEFPMVVLADTAAGSGSWGVSLYTTPTDERDAGLPVFSYNTKDRENFGNNNSMEADAALHADLKRKSAARDDAESRRLFYVALTRAETHLLICNTRAYPGTRKKPGSFGAYLDHWLDTMPDPGLFDRQIIAVRETMALLDGTDPYLSAGRETKPPSLGLIPRDRLDEAAKTGFMTVKPVTLKPDFPEPGPEPGSETMKPTATPDSGTAQSDVFIRHSQAPGTEDPVFEQPGTRRDEALHGPVRQWSFLEASLAGTLIHKGIELSLRAPEHTRRLLVNAAAMYGVDLMDPKAEADLREMERQVDNARTWLLGQFPGARQWRHEVAFEAQLNGLDGEAQPGIVRGVIDLLVQASDGEWHLVDFKSSVPAGEPVVFSREAGYHGQLDVYCRAAFSITQGRVAIKPAHARLLFTSGNQALTLSLKDIR